MILTEVINCVLIKDIKDRNMVKAVFFKRIEKVINNG